MTGRNTVFGERYHWETPPCHDARIVVAAPGVDSIAKDPPESSARSFVLARPNICLKSNLCSRQIVFSRSKCQDSKNVSHCRKEIIPPFPQCRIVRSNCPQNQKRPIRSGITDTAYEPCPVRWRFYSWLWLCVHLFSRQYME